MDSLAECPKNGHIEIRGFEGHSAAPLTSNGQLSPRMDSLAENHPAQVGDVCRGFDLETECSIFGLEGGVPLKLGGALPPGIGKDGRDPIAFTRRSLSCTLSGHPPKRI